MLNKKVKKYKKIFEKPVFYKYGYEINGTIYHLVVYKKGEKTSGSAIISETDEQIQDIDDALKILVRLALSMDNLNGTLNDIYYRELPDIKSNSEVIKRILNKHHLEPQLQESYDNTMRSNEIMLQAQEDIRKAGKEFLAFKAERDKTNQYLPGDEEILFDLQARLHLYQIDSMKIYQEHFNDFVLVYEDIKKNYRGEVSQQQLKYLGDSTRESVKEKGRKSIEMLSGGAGPHIDPENLVRHLKEDYDKGVQETIVGIRNRLRYPTL